MVVQAVSSIAGAPPLAAETFDAHRSRLFAIAYRMLGSAMEAEDAVQDTYLRYHAALARDGGTLMTSGTVESPWSPGAFLTTVVTRLCLDRLKSARAVR